MQLPPRHWRKVVAATQGSVLAVAAADILPSLVTRAALLAALALLAESFGRDVWWLRSRRHAVDGRVATVVDRRGDAPVAPRPGRQRGRARAVVGTALTILALLAVWVALVAPDELNRLTPERVPAAPARGSWSRSR